MKQIDLARKVMASEMTDHWQKNRATEQLCNQKRSSFLKEIQFEKKEKQTIIQNLSPVTSLAETSFSQKTNHENFTSIWHIFEKCFWVKLHIDFTP